ncbi:MAG: 3-dehydroquinate synthase [Lachnospiraceae bacterium]|jgi:3-dehydroquinate synthase|nr:3-dehydroquinate synthase [Clostridiaceae bacterium]MDY4545992.1 3-dehydroquinate synthase [Candidatus Choladocola sp.]
MNRVKTEIPATLEEAAQAGRVCMDVKKDGQFCYHIYLEPDFAKLPEAVEPLNIKERKLCIVADSTTAELYGAELKEILKETCTYVSMFVFPAGEVNKTLNTVRDLYEHLILEKFDRKDMLVALGGGVVGDLTGFAAATYLRGIGFIQIPTTLLSQVDSSIGGKTGVDFDAYKNMVGAFHMPRLVYMNLNVLKTLPDRQFACGMGEIIKHGLIQDSDYLEKLSTYQREIREKNYAALLWMVAGSCKVKRHVVEEDPTEQGIRAWLNFGHTIGHSVEKLKDFTLCHGECVAIGCAAAAWMSWKRGLISEKEKEAAEQLLLDYQLPVRVKGLKPEDIVKTTKLDKKMDAGKVKFVLLKKIGEAFVTRDVEDEELLRASRYVCGEEIHE